MVGALFDTNILVDYLKALPEARLELERYASRAISVVTWMEVLVGCDPERLGPTRRFLQGFDQVSLSPAVAERAVSLRRAHRIKLPDAVIWASAQVEGRLLVTRNTKDFPPGDPGVRTPYRL